MNKNDIVPLKIEKFKTLNRTLGYCDNIPVFVKGGMPGQTAEVKIKRKRSNVCEADLINVLSPPNMKESQPAPLIISATAARILACLMKCR